MINDADENENESEAVQEVPGNRIAYLSSQSQIPLKMEHYSFTWEVENFAPLRDMFSTQNALPSGRQFSVQSSLFQCGNTVGKGSQWYLSLGLQYHKNGNNFISLHLCLKKFLNSIELQRSRQSVYVAFRLQILGHNRDILDSGQSGIIQFGLNGSGQVPCWGWDDFVPYNEIVSDEGTGGRDFIFQNRIRFCVEMDIFGEQRKSASSLSTASSAASSSMLPMGEQGNNLNEEMGALIDGKHSDCQILTSDGKIIKSHKAILAARSPLMRNLFEDSEEPENGDGEVVVSSTSTLAKTGIIHQLKDYTYDAIKNVLKHIYTDAPVLHIIPRGCQGEVKRIIEMLEIAQILFLEKLQFDCFENLCNYNLNYSTAGEIILLLYKYNADKVFQKIVKDYVLENLNELKRNEKFKTLYKYNVSAFSDLIYEF